jgi:hypothetical protein
MAISYMFHGLYATVVVLCDVPADVAMRGRRLTPGGAGCIVLVDQAPRALRQDGD